jgi:tetratricopeptide (TPR) repeat protein
MKKKQSRDVPGKKQALALLSQGKFQQAANSFASLCKQVPRDHELWIMYGICLEKSGSSDQAINALRQALTLKPASAKAHYWLGMSYFRKGWVEPSVASLSRALEIKSDYKEAHASLTRLLEMAGMYHETIRACRKALEVSPDAPDIHCRLAEALEKTNQLDDARKTVSRVIDTDPGNVQAQYILAKLDRRSGQLEAARDRLLALTHLGMAPTAAATVHSELGDVLDRMGEYSRAFEQYQLSNDQLAGTVTGEAVNKNRLIDQVGNLKNYFTEQTTRGWDSQPPGQEREAPIFLVGFPRSGTTLTEQVVSSVGRIVPSDEKPFVNRLASELPSLLGRPVSYPYDLHNLDANDIQRLRQRYWELVEGMLCAIGDDRRLLDKLPLNLIDIGLIYRIFPDAKVIVVLRDPRDCCLSCFMQPFQPNQAMVNFLSLDQSARFYAAVMDLWLQYRAVLKLDFIEVRYEDMVFDLETQARRLLDFMGEPWDDGVLKYYERAGTRNITTPSYSAVASPIYHRSANRWKNYEAYFENLDDQLQRFVKEFGYG